MRKVVGVAVGVAALLSVGAAQVGARPFPDSIALPVGFNPEGIAVGPGTTFYVGSLIDGDVYRADLRSGAGEVLVDAPEGRIAVGLAVDLAGGRLFVAGGPTGHGFVYDLRTGADLGAFELAAPDGATFVNDVTVTRVGAWFTDSNRPVLYRIPFLPGGALGTPEVLPLTGEAADVSGPFNLNGIDATPDGKTLVVVHSTLAALFTVDPATGATTRIEVDQPLPAGDGILLDGPRVWVVQNFLNQVTEVRLSPDLSSGSVVSTITSPLLRIPTTVARHGDRLAVVNARFDLGIPAPPGTDFDVVLLDR
jgi:sugar lactone lactonase YvrE